MREEGGNGNTRGIKILGAVLLVAVLVTALGCCCTRSTQATVYRPAAARAPTPPAAEGQPVVPPGSTSDSLTTVEMRNVHFRLDSTLVLRIHRLKGTMQPRSGRQVIDFGLKVYMPDYAALGRGGSSVRPTDRRATGERDAASRRPRPVSSTGLRDHG